VVGRIDHDVKAPEPRQCLFDRALDGRLVGRIEMDPQRRVPRRDGGDFFHRTIQPLPVGVTDDNARPLPGERDAGRKPEVAGAAGHESHFAAQVEHRSTPPSSRSPGRAHRGVEIVEMPAQRTSPGTGDSKPATRSSTRPCARSSMGTASP